MIKIYKLIRRIYEVNKNKWHVERSEGFKDCLLLFLTGIEKHPAYNVHLENNELKEEIYKLKHKIKRLEGSPINRLTQDLEAKLEEYKKHLIISQRIANKRNKLIEAYKLVLKESGLKDKVSRAILDLEDKEKEYEKYLNKL